MQYRTTVQEFKNGINVNHIPILTPEEYEEQRKRVERAAINLLLEAEKKKQKKHESA